eukprot:gene7161-8539_t
MDEAASLMQLNWVTRKAVRLINGLEIAISEDVFTLTVLSVIPWFKVVESYPMNGSEKVLTPANIQLVDIAVSTGANVCERAGSGNIADVTFAWGTLGGLGPPSPFTLHA